MIYENSRYRFCLGVRNSDEVLLLDEREPVRFRDAPDNQFHTVVDGDTWWGLAHAYFRTYPRPCGLWWVLCEYQPTPVVDPTLRLQAGATVVIPPERVLREAVFHPSQRRYH